jgi:putative heme iron utilization protein
MKGSMAIMRATLRRMWWVIPAALLALAWPEMREWGVVTWVVFSVAVVLVVVVYAALFVSGTISQAEDRRKWEREQARARVAMGREEEA